MNASDHSRSVSPSTPSTIGRSLARVLSVLALFLAVACRSGGGGDDGSSIPQGTYYTRFGIHIDGRGTVFSTNYRSGVLVPVNTEVEYLAKGKRSQFKMQLADGGRPFVFQHVAKHTMDSASEAFDAFFSPEPVDLSGFSAEEQAAIQEARVVPGMSKDAVLAAMGPPPATGTLSLDSNAWKYWRTRWATFYVEFDEEGKVTGAGR